MNADGVVRFQRAAEMAATAHEGQKISSTEIPYIAHPVRVAGLVMGVFGCADSEIVAGALLHDALEKTSLPGTEIARELGPKVLQLVLALTKAEGDEEGYWKVLSGATWEARLIKMGDAMDHLNCTFKDLPRRIETAGRALSLAYSDEEPIRNARQALQEALRAAEVRLAMTLAPD